MNKLYLLLALLILLPICAAEQVNTDLSLTVQCTNSTYANLTYAKYVSTSYYLINSEKAMTKQGIRYNYTIPSANNTIAGTIEYGYKCDVNGQEQSAGNLITVNLMGEELTSGQATLYIIMMVGLLLIFFITVYGAVAIPWKNPRDEEGMTIGINDLKYLKVVLWVFAYLEMLFIVMILKNLSGYLFTEGTYEFFNVLFIVMLSAMVPFFPLLIFFTIVIWLTDKKVLKNIQRGILE